MAIKLSDKDWEILLPEKPFKIGTQTIYLRPLTIEQISRGIAELNALREELAKRGIDAENYQARLPEVFECVLEHALGLLSEITGIEAEDLRRLPISIGVALLEAILEANGDDFLALSERLRKMTDRLRGLVSGLQSSFAGSSGEDTGGAISADTP